MTTKRKRIEQHTFTRSDPLPLCLYGPLSPMRVETDEPITFPVTLKHPGSYDAIHAFVERGVIPTCEKMLSDWEYLDQYLDIPIFKQVMNKTWETIGDVNLWLYKLRGYDNYNGLNANFSAWNGQLKTLEWIMENGGEWTSDAADYASRNGHLETLKWIMENGGDWSSNAANYAAMNGHLETLKWIRVNGGDWSHKAADWAAMNGHLETLKWIVENGGDWTHEAAHSAARNGHLETLKWITDNGGPCSYWAADLAARHGRLETLKWITEKGGYWSRHATEWAVQNGHLEILKWIHANGGARRSSRRPDYFAAFLN